MKDEEAEANYFAMCLLMPEDFVRAEIRKLRSFDLNNEKQMAELARKFQVSVAHIALRLGQLGIV